MTDSKPINSIIWSDLSNMFQNRTSTELRNKYMYLMPSVVKGSWTAEEDMRIEIGYRVFGSNWAKIAASAFTNDKNECTRTMV